jgi:hypothetical protein
VVVHDDESLADLLAAARRLVPPRVMRVKVVDMHDE